MNGMRNDRIKAMLRSRRNRKLCDSSVFLLALGKIASHVAL